MWWVLIPIGLIFLIPKESAAKMIDPFYNWDSLIKKYSSIYNVPFEWIKAIMMNESNLGQAPSVKRGLLNPSDIEGSKSSDGKSWGLMQLTLPTARMFEPLVTEAGLNDPEISIRIGAKYLAYLMAKNPAPFTKMEFIVRAYNGGPGFNSTVKGRNDTPIYYQRFLKNLSIIENKKS